LEESIRPDENPCNVIIILGLGPSGLIRFLDTAQFLIGQKRVRVSTWQVVLRG
jgi:hypothetical protein